MNLDYSTNELQHCINAQYTHGFLERRECLETWRGVAEDCEDSLCAVEVHSALRAQPLPIASFNNYETSRPQLRSP